MSMRKRAQVQELLFSQGDPMTKREEIEAQLSELTQAEIAELLAYGGSMLRRMQGGSDAPFFSVKVDTELVCVFGGNMADLMQTQINALMQKHGGQQVRIGE
jgi:hypothetical protein